MAVKSLTKGYLALAASVLLVAQAQATELLNSSYDVSRELFAALNPQFEQQWAKDNGGDKLTIKQSHAGSSKQALAILQGLKADVVTYNQVTDVQILHDKGKLIPADWQSRLPNNSSPFYSTMGFLVRKGCHSRRSYLHCGRYDARWTRRREKRSEPRAVSGSCSAGICLR